MRWELFSTHFTSPSIVMLIILGSSSTRTVNVTPFKNTTYTTPTPTNTHNTHFISSSASGEWNRFGTTAVAVIIISDKKQKIQLPRKTTSALTGGEVPVVLVPFTHTSKYFPFFFIYVVKVEFTLKYYFWYSTSTTLDCCLPVCRTIFAKANGKDFHLKNERVIKRKEKNIKKRECGE